MGQKPPTIFNTEQLQGLVPPQRPQMPVQVFRTFLAEASLTGLNPSTTYYYRFTATNNAGTGYGSDLSFRTTYPSTIYVNSNGGCGDKSPCHTNIQTAIDAAQNGFAILIAGGTYNGPFILDQPISLTLQGGWDSAFSDQTESTILKEAPKGETGIADYAGAKHKALIYVATIKSLAEFTES